jgi:hypothetical protein
MNTSLPHAGAKTLDRRHLVEVERDALRAPLVDVDHHHLADEVLLRRELRAGHADVAGADDGQLALRNGRHACSPVRGARFRP